MGWPRTMKTSSTRPKHSPYVRRLPVIRLSFRCCTASAATFSKVSCVMVGVCGSTSRLERNGIRISCAGWPNGQRMCSSSRRIFYGADTETGIGLHGVGADFVMDRHRLDAAQQFPCLRLENGNAVVLTGEFLHRIQRIK